MRARRKLGPVPPARSFALLYAAQFAGFGAMMPFLPAILADGGLDAAQVGIVLALGTLTQVAAAPTLGRLADRAGATRRVLVLSALGAACAALGYLLAAGFALLLIARVLHGMGVAAIIPLTDSLALRAPGVDYAPVRAIGSLAFIGGAVAAGALVQDHGPRAAALMLAGGMLLAAAAARSLPAPRKDAGGGGPGRGGGSLLAPLRQPGVAPLLLLSAAVQGSHIVYYGYSTLLWTGAGISPARIGVLWGLGVLAEVLLFWRGTGLADRLGARGLALLAAGAGVLRWSLCAVSTEFWILLPVTALHGLTFGAMHLAAMRALRRLPAEMAGRAQTLHSAAVGAASGTLMLLGGALYAALGGGAFWAMAGLCLLALPLAARLR